MMLKTGTATTDRNQVETIFNWTSGTWLQNDSEATTIDELCIDTRKIAHPETALFIALTTRHRDGHSFITNAYEQGVRNFLVSADVDITPYKGKLYQSSRHTYCLTTDSHWQQKTL